jgi:hypothetical protein
LISPYVTVFFDKILRLRDQVWRSKELNG